ncbi:hypothetical protein DCO57_01435 [Labrenzia sp. 011]|nr:hypothetical protein DCO57_01435 [Labrenzia sp. 011]
MVLTLSAVLLGACSGRPEIGALALNSAPAEGAKAHDIFIVATRARDERPDTYFSGERSDEINYAEARISVPPVHKPGVIEWPASLPGNPEADFVARSAAYLPSANAFKTRLNQELATRPRGKREVFLFIHGYNTLFAESLYRLTQFVHDANSDAVPVLFSWASRGKLRDYLYDLNSAAIARDALEKTLTDLAQSDADEISILAHSMGNYLLMETIRQMPPSLRQKIQKKVHYVVLAAPDIDIDLFKSHLRRLGHFQKPFVVIVSTDDRALRLSRALSGGVDRLGAYSDDEELAKLGAIVIDVTDLEAGDSAHHSKFAMLAEFAPELQSAFANGSLTSESSLDGTRTFGGDLGSFVGTTAQTALTLPIRIIAAPVVLATGGSL